MKKRLVLFALLFCVTAALCALSGLAADAEPVELTAELTAEPVEPSELTAEITVEDTSAALRTAPLPGDGEKPLALPPKGDEINATVIQSVSVEITEPFVGAKPDYNPLFYLYCHSYSADYSSGDFRNDVVWYDTTDSFYLDPDKDVFVQEHEYQVTIYATAEEGYGYSSGTRATVNSNDAVSSLYGGQLKIEYTFPPAGIITKATIYQIEAPVEGNTPDYHPPAPTSAKYYSADFSFANYMKNDISWLDVTAGKRVAVTDTFIAGHQYQVTVYYTAKEGYAFTEETTGSIYPSGGPYVFETFAAEAELYNDQLCITYTFPATLKGIPEISITCAPPILGKHPDYEPLLPSDAVYEIYDANDSELRHGVGWSDKTEMKTLSPSDTFGAKDHEYRIRVCIKPEDGYTFNGPCYINGIEATFSGGAHGWRIYYINYYGAYEEIKAVSAMITAPKTGEKPSYDPTFPAGANYASLAGYRGENTYEVNGVVWKDNTSGSYMVPNESTFSAGHQYTAYIIIGAKDGYVFNQDELYAFVNGESADGGGCLDNPKNTVLQIYYTFPALPTLSSIKVTKAPTKTAYTEGEKFDKAGMVVTATYSDGSTKKVTSYTYKPTAALKTTDAKITISYTEDGVTKTTTTPITVKAKTLTGIKVTTPPTKTTYTEGEKFSKTGMVVTASYDNGTTAKVTDYTYKPTAALKTTDAKVTISYTEDGVTKTATTPITVKAKTLTGIKVTTPPTKTTYTEGEKFSKTGMVVTASYDNGTTAKVTDYTFKPTAALKTTDTKITISYTENGVTKTTTQKITVKAKSGTVTRGDVNGDGKVNSNDAIHLLRHTMSAERYPINQSGDMNGDGKVNSNDAIHLLRHTMSPERYPLKG